jgi:3'-phosphoadenosine 5'-phosphosulfate sulfotransferase (PAPS reductase)/FAD synthetase
MCSAISLVEHTPAILELLEKKAPVALGVSGGKDSSAMAFATTAYLDAIGHQGPRILIHSDLGRLEWKASLPMCQILASRLGLELIVVRRQAGDLLDRWLVRWQNNCARYANLECVKLILPWSTAGMRFCTSELKTAIICRDLVERFAGSTIISASGIRSQESPNRAKAPIFAPQLKLISKTFGTYGFDWHPLLRWTLEEVLSYHQVCHFPLHEAYTLYGTSRVSCVFCILSSLADLLASSTCAENHEIYRELVDIEIISTFSFKGDTWLGDIANHLLSEEQRAGLEEAKRRAARRREIEARIPKHLEYTAGWPTVMPSYAEACLLGEVRAAVAAVMILPISYVEPYAILDRFAELIEEKRRKDEAKKKHKRVPVVYAKGAMPI